MLIKLSPLSLFFILFDFLQRCTKGTPNRGAGFKKYIPETTKIIIAQRVASVEDADMIIVMDNGKITAIGKHNDLLEKSDIYREVYNQQVSGGDCDEE